MSKLLKRRSGDRVESTKAENQLIEQLEDRVLLSDGPRVTSIAPDNRGQVAIYFDQQLKAGSYNAYSVQLLMANSLGKYVPVPTSIVYSYNATTRVSKLTATAPSVRANQIYRIHLLSTGTWGIKSAVNGLALDGEFKGATLISGNGIAGGDYWATTMNPSTVIVRFTSIYGPLDVKMFNVSTAAYAGTPKTVANFLNYANRGLYDGTFIHRSVPGFVIQGGGFNVTATNTVGQIQTFAAVVNEAHPGNPGNIRGTIAMAKLGNDPNSATNQWFFNLVDNRANLDAQNGGFTAFGMITTTPQVSQAVGLSEMDRIARLPIQHYQDPFSDVPTVNYTAGTQLNPKANLVVFSRIAELVTLGAVPVTAAAVTAAAPKVATQPAIAAGTFSTTAISPATSVSTTDALLGKTNQSVLP